MLEIEQVSHTYSDGTPALDGVTLSIDRGRAVGNAWPQWGG